MRSRVRVSRFLLIVALLVACGRAAPSFAQATPPICDVRTVTSNATTPVFDVSHTSGAVSAWLKIVTAGSGTPSVAVNLYGPPVVSGGAESTTNRPVARLCDLVAAQTACGIQDIQVSAMTATITGCTGSCDLRVALCTSRQ